MSATDDLVDFALAAYRLAGEWQVQSLTTHHLADVEVLAEALRRPHALTRPTASSNSSPKPSRSAISASASSG